MMTQPQNPPLEDRFSSLRAEKAAYTVPKLERLGSVKALTGGPRSGLIDTLFGGDGGFRHDEFS